MTESFSRARDIALAVRDVGGRALLVGGWVRDRLMGRDCKDIDIEVFGIPAARLKTLLESLGRVETVGESFQVFKAGDIDVSLPRRESKQGRGHKGFEVAGDPTMTVEEAARRRDFRINAILWDPLTEEYLDPFDGRGDIANRVLRVVDPTTFCDDSLRALRAIQFAARFELQRGIDGRVVRFRAPAGENNLPGIRPDQLRHQVLRVPAPGVEDDVESLPIASAPPLAATPSANAAARSVRRKRMG